MLAGTELILDYFKRDKFFVLIIQGKNGSGKSAYAVNLLAEVYSDPGSKYGNWDISMFKKHMGYSPRRVVGLWQKQKERTPAFLWDDAGVWLHSLDYANGFVKSIGKFLQVARTKYSCIIFTAISKDDIVSKIRNFGSTIVVDVINRGDINSKYKSQKYRAMASAWVYWSDRLGQNKGTETIYDEPFCCYMPDDFYSWYLPQRKYYCDIQEKLMMEQLKKQKDIMKIKGNSF